MRDAGRDSAEKATEPAHPAAAQKKVAQRLLAPVFGHEQQLCPEDAADEGGDRSVRDLTRKPTRGELAPHHPQADEDADGHENAEARDLERTDAEKDRMHS